MHGQKNIKLDNLKYEIICGIIQISLLVQAYIIL